MATPRGDKKSRYLPTSANLEPRSTRLISPFFASVIGLSKPDRRAIDFGMRLVALLLPKTGVSVNCVILMPRYRR
jgi:hypothetical protein